MDASISRRGIAKQFKLNDAAVDRHFHNHLKAKIAKAVAKRAEKEGDIYMERHEHLYGEALQYIEDAKGAIKMQKVTCEVETENGIKLEERYKEFRDVGAMAPALTAATALQRQLGDATARFAQQPASHTSVHLSVILPRAIEAAPKQANQQVAIDASCARAL